ncbi:Spo0E family sporulation regulatory protein-aspartic acid phosphatase [Aliibacillus thermotolerans]|mgnify:FL=1|uniref:Spo0E family sporulation regulatory protein-aspartic acid phosphatase n=1 Tax=Aliibacillus thermotolerans TaxID=1834418 RepID=A0ABW0U798_9BACI|nr:aspartyl-phosphate phosphatase Spo0E family protein [Aliibacillus thermotolerans]
MVRSEYLEVLREKMIMTAKDLGMSHPLVLKYSKEIDKEHNKLLDSLKKDFPPEKQFYPNKSQIV